MCGDYDAATEQLSSGLESWSGATALAMKTLNDMKRRSKMAAGWSCWSFKMHKYYKGIKSDYDEAIKSLDGPSSEHQKRVSDLKERSLREGGYGGGLEEYKLLERELKDFGPSLEQDRYNSPTPFSRGSTHPPNVKVESTTAYGDGGWAAVNAAAPPQPAAPANTTGRLEELSAAAYTVQSPADPRGTYYSRVSAASPTNPPSMISTSTPRSGTADINSPYQNPNASTGGFATSAYPQGPSGSYPQQPQQQQQQQQQPVWNGSQEQQQANQDQAFKQLEQINMQGVDVAMFGGSLDGNYFPGDDWQAVVGPTGQNGGMNFMEAAARPSGNGSYGPYAQE